MNDFITIADTPLMETLPGCGSSSCPVSRKRGGQMTNGKCKCTERGHFNGHGWLGVSCSTQAEVDERVTKLLRKQESRRFLLLTPIEAISLSPYATLDGVKVSQAVDCDFVIVKGGDTPLHPAGVRSIRDQCVAAGVPFYFAGWGEWIPSNQDGCYGAPWVKRVDIGMNGQILKETDMDNDWCAMYRVGSDKSGRLLDGREWLELPNENRKEITP